MLHAQLLTTLLVFCSLQATSHSLKPRKLNALMDFTLEYSDFLFIFSDDFFSLAERKKGDTAYIGVFSYSFSQCREYLVNIL